MAIRNPFSKTLPVKDSQEIFNEKSQAFSDALEQLEIDKQQLEDLHLQNASNDQILKVEDAVTKSTVTLTRAEKARDAWHKRLIEAGELEYAKQFKDNEKIISGALKRRIATAKKLDELAETLKAAKQELQATSKILKGVNGKGALSMEAKGMYSDEMTEKLINRALYHGDADCVKIIFKGKKEHERKKTVLETVKYHNKNISIKSEMPPQPAIEGTQAANVAVTASQKIETPFNKEYNAKPVGAASKYI